MTVARMTSSTAFLVLSALLTSSPASAATVESVVADVRAEAQQLRAQGERLPLATLRGLQSDVYLARRHAEPTASFETQHKAWPMAQVFVAVDALVRRPRGDGGPIFKFTQPGDVAAHFGLDAKQRAALAGKEHDALVTGLLLQLGASLDDRVPLLLQSLPVAGQPVWDAARWMAYGQSLRRHAQQDTLLRPLLQVAQDRSVDVMVRQAAAAALGSVPSEAALESASMLLADVDLQRAALSALSRSGDARLARRHRRPQVAERALQMLTTYAASQDSSTLEADVVARAMVGCALTPTSLQDAAEQLQKTQPALSRRLLQYAQLQARRRR